MGTHALYVRFPDGTIRHGAYASASDLARPYLFDSQEVAEEARYSHDAPYDPAADGFGEPVEVATVYADGFHWRGTAIRDWLTSGGDPFGADGYADGIPDWLTEHLRAECERTRVDLCDSLESLADALDEHAAESLELATATFEATAETWPHDVRVAKEAR